MKYTVESSREWYNNLPGKRASAGMIVRYDQKILMIKDDYKFALTFPGGVIDPDESAREAAIRETQEEVGLRIAPESVRFLSVAYIGEQNGFKDRFHFFFIADIDHMLSEAIHLEDGVEYYEWVRPEAVAAKAGDRGVYNGIARIIMSKDPVPYFEC